MEIHFFGSSDIGKSRTTNEDFFINEKIGDDEYLFAVADGMGGHQAGDVASKLACQSFTESFRLLRKKGHPIPESLEVAVKKANVTILKKAQADPGKRGMGTTFSALIVSGLKGYIIHIGDSRIYMVRDNQISKLTTDHTFVEKLVEDGRISVEEAREHPQKNVLYMSLGVREGFTPEIISEFAIEDGDLFLMCSDGLSNMISEDLIRDYALSYYPEEAVNNMIKLANSNGGLDNITLQIVRIGSFEVLEKTKPIRKVKTRQKVITLISLAILVAIFVGVWFLFFSSPSAPNPIGPKKVLTAAAVDQAQQLEFTAMLLDGAGLLGVRSSIADYRFFSNNRLVMENNNAVSIYDVKSGVLESINTKARDIVIPTSTRDVYYLRRLDPSVFEYQVVIKDKAEPRLVIKADKYFIKEREMVAIPSPVGELMPLFINEDTFVFNDASHYHVFRNWSNKELQYYQIPHIRFSLSAHVGFRMLNGKLKMIHYRPEEKIVRVLDLTDGGKVIREVPDVALGIPSAIEAVSDDLLVFYFANQMVVVGGNRLMLEKGYPVPLESAVKRIFVDFGMNQCLLLDEKGNLFLMEIKND